MPQPSCRETLRRSDLNADLIWLRQTLSLVGHESNLLLRDAARPAGDASFASAQDAGVWRVQNRTAARECVAHTRTTGRDEADARREVMDITIDERLIGNVTVLDLAGRLTMDQAAQHLKDKINSLVSQQRTEIVVNLRKVPYIDSGGLGQLVASFASVRKAGGVLKLLNVGSRNSDLLSITRLVTVFESFDSEAEAVESFQSVARAAAPH
jgi:anti-sigma B factor antagonist